MPLKILPLPPIDEDNMKHSFSRRAVLGGALAALLVQRTAAADPAPSIRLVVPSSAGGPLDALSRVLAQSLGRHLEANVVVANVPGATGKLAAVQVANARPDGRTLLLGTSATHAIAASLFPQLPYRPEQDFAAIGRICTARFVLVAHPSFQARSLDELIDAARAAPTPLAYGSWGVGSGGHLAVEAIRMQFGIDLNHVPYQGTVSMMQDLLGGRIPLAISDTAGAIARVREGKLVPLIVTGTTRLAQLPQVSTFGEAQVPFTTESWCGLFAPARTPVAELARLEAALRAALEDLSVKQTLSTLVYDPGPMDRQAFRKLWQADIAAWRRVVVATGIRLD